MLVVDVDGFEGPLDLLLELARRQKVDLTQDLDPGSGRAISRLRRGGTPPALELAADYLVMAAWLAFLKSRLLLPDPPKGEEPPAADLALALAFRLKRLEAMRNAAQALQDRAHLGRDVFRRGMPEAVRGAENGPYEASLYDLLSAYAQQRQRSALSEVRFTPRKVWTLAEAREILERLIGPSFDWTPLDGFLIDYVIEPAMRATVRASGFSASLEMAKEGKLDLRQDKAFAPIYLRARKAQGDL